MQTRQRIRARTPFVVLDETSDRPLYEQIYAAVRDHIVQGRMPPGMKLVSSRTLAFDLGVSRFTVVTAFDALTAEGYISAAPRGGTFVTRTLPDASLRAVRRRADARGGHRTPPLADGGREPHDLLSARGRSIGGLVITGPRSAEPRPFQPRRPPLDVFPVALWSRLVRRQWRTRRHQMLDYGEPAGLSGLREAIAEHTGSTRGVECTAEQVIVTSGAQQALNLIFQLLLDPGDAAWIEEPGYLDARAALIAQGARTVAVPVDADGIVVQAGRTAALRAKLSYVSPSHQYPTGVTMSASRRIELLQWAHETGAWIVEDDYDSYFRYRGRPFPALQRLESDRLASRSLTAGRAQSRVLYVGTFSKTMFPSLRLGYCIVPPELAHAIANTRAIADRNASLTDQAALEAFIRDGHYDRHLRRVRMACAERYEAMLDAADRHLGGAVMLEPMSAGTHLLGRLAPGLPSPKRLEQLARDAGLVLFPLSRYCMTPPAQDAIILGYGGLTPRAIDAGVRRLAEVLGR